MVVLLQAALDPVRSMHEPEAKETSTVGTQVSPDRSIPTPELESIELERAEFAARIEQLETQVEQVQPPHLHMRDTDAVLLSGIGAARRRGGTGSHAIYQRPAAKPDR